MNKRKKDLKSKWKNRGVKFTDEEFEFIWGIYENIENCMLCSKHFNDSFDKCLDHNHSTGEVRYILCRSCNVSYDTPAKCNNKLGQKHIIEYHDNYKIQIHFPKRKYTLEDVIKMRDELLSSNASS